MPASSSHLVIALKMNGIRVYFAASWVIGDKIKPALKQIV